MQNRHFKIRTYVYLMLEIIILKESYGFGDTTRLLYKWSYMCVNPCSNMGGGGNIGEKYTSRLRDVGGLGSLGACPPPKKIFEMVQFGAFWCVFKKIQKLLFLYKILINYYFFYKNFKNYYFLCKK